MGVLNKKLRRDLWAMKSQSLAIAAVMAAGIATFVMSLGLIFSLQETRDSFYERYRFADVFVSLKRAPESLAARIRAMPGVRQVETRVVIGATLDIEGMVEPATGLLLSIPEEGEPKLNALHMRSGRYIEPYRENEVILAEPFAEANGLRPGDTLSAVISGHQKKLLVVGTALSPEHIYSMAPGGLFPDNKRFGVMWLGRDGLEAAHDMDGAFNDLTLSVAYGTDVDDLIEEIDHLTKPYGGLGAVVREDQVSDEYLQNELDQLKAMAYVVPVIFLAVASFLLHTVLTRLIALEREQIGALKALGLTNGEIGWHYAKLSLVIAAMAFVLGLLLGLWFGYSMASLYAELFRFPSLEFSIRSEGFALAAILTIGVTILGVRRPVERAMKLPPAEAMRPAPPPSFKPTFFERMGLHDRLYPVTRMIVRQLERNWRRALISSLGVAASVGMLIASSFNLDAIDFIVDFQFSRSDRADVTLSLNEPQSKRAFFDAQHLPGVLSAEPFRTVPVRLRFEHLSKRLGIMGVAPGGDLFRSLDIDLQPVPIPSEGIVLASKLADILNVTTGDRLTVEVLEGRRPTHEVYVSGVVESYVGLSALMDIDALNRLMQEGPSVSGAWIKVDTSQLRRFHEQIKETPAVAGISMQREALLSFLDTMGESLQTMTIANILLASLIAFGVVYNAARISLSERARELASLRVLGFSRREISSILLGELAIVVLAALPVGCLMGYGLVWLIVQSMDTELFRIPFYISKLTYGSAVLSMLVAAAFSALVVRRRLDNLDLVAVLKTRE